VDILKLEAQHLRPMSSHLEQTLLFIGLYLVACAIQGWINGGVQIRAKRQSALDSFRAGQQLIRNDGGRWKEVSRLEGRNGRPVVIERRLD
jgi:hypothetical protein